MILLFLFVITATATATDLQFGKISVLNPPSFLHPSEDNKYSMFEILIFAISFAVIIATTLVPKFGF